MVSEQLMASRGTRGRRREGKGGCGGALPRCEVVEVQGGRMGRSGDCTQLSGDNVPCHRQRRPHTSGGSLGTQPQNDGPDIMVHASRMYRAGLKL